MPTAARGRLPLPLASHYSHSTQPSALAFFLTVSLHVMGEGAVTAMDQLMTELMGFPLLWSLDMSDEPSRASSHGGCFGGCATTAAEGRNGGVDDEPPRPTAPATTGGLYLLGCRTAQPGPSAPFLARRPLLHALEGVSGGGSGSSGGSGGTGGRDGRSSSVDCHAGGLALRRRRSPSGWSPFSTSTPDTTPAAGSDSGQGRDGDGGKRVGVCDAVGRLSTWPTGGDACVRSSALRFAPSGRRRGDTPGQRLPAVWAGDVGGSALDSALTDLSADDPGAGNRGERQQRPPPPTAALVLRPRAAAPSVLVSFDTGKVLLWGLTSDDEDDSGEGELDSDPEDAAAVAAAAAGAPSLPVATATTTAGAPGPAQAAGALTAVASPPTTVPPSSTETAMRVRIAGLSSGAADWWTEALGYRSGDEVVAAGTSLYGIQVRMRLSTHVGWQTSFPRPSLDVVRRHTKYRVLSIRVKQPASPTCDAWCSSIRVRTLQQPRRSRLHVWQNLPARSVHETSTIGAGFMQKCMRASGVFLETICNEFMPSWLF